MSCPTPAAPRPSLLACALAAAMAAGAPAAFAQDAPDEQTGRAATLDTVHVTAAQISKQALGASVITADDIARRPPANDLSELLRTMPGVNLTGNSASGQFGNHRQIDLRGMGPENTLILVDGKPVGSRDSVRMGRSGERNSRGDTNWVPAEAVERIEVLRGPAAARYGSGASGGVVNIITRKPTGELAGSLSLYGLVPMHGDEGGGQRVGTQLSGPLADRLSFRLFANANRTDPDALELNAAHATGPTPPAGREGVENKDINGLLRLDANDAHVFELELGSSRQGNIFAGERAVSATGTALLTELARDGAETNRMYRNSASLTHRGSWGANSTRLTYAYEATNNKRLNEGLMGGLEGSIGNATTWSTSRLRNHALDGELNMPRTFAGHDHVITLGFDLRDSALDDPYSMTQGSADGGGIPGVDDSKRSGRNDAQSIGVFIEDNAYLGERWIVTPGLRLDHHSQFGNNASPSLNLQFAVNDDLKFKGGIARAFKAPNLYQNNPDYLYYTRGNGCPVIAPNLGSGCYVRGNDQLDAETSLNKEFGIEWAPAGGQHLSLTYFHNDYKDKIVAGSQQIGLTNDTRGRVFQWTSAPDAVVQGFEGNVMLPLLGDRGSVLQWNSNLTWMIENKDTTTGQPLSVIPRYTLNSALDWRPTAALSVLLAATFYGEQEAATMQPTTGAPLLPDVRGAYAVWNLSGRYRITERISVGAGINNLLDKRQFRDTNSLTAAGMTQSSAATYNEPGRAFFASMTIGF